VYNILKKTFWFLLHLISQGLRNKIMFCIYYYLIPIVPPVCEVHLLYTPVSVAFA